MKTSRSQSQRLVVIGGSTVVRARDGRWATKIPVADYLHELAGQFDTCTWITVETPGVHYRGEINNAVVNVVTVPSGRWRLPVQWWRVLRTVHRDAYVLGYLSTLLRLLPIVWLIRSRSRRIAVYLAGDYQMQVKAYLRERRWIRARLFRFGFEHPMRIGDAVIARGKRLATLARRFNETVFETVPIAHMIETAMSDLANQQSLRILYVGKLLRSKGVAELLDAVATIDSRHPKASVELKIVGDGPDRDDLIAHSTRITPREQIEFLGWVDEPGRLAAILDSASVVVVPSSSYPEGVPRVIDEAIARGRPVVATRVGGVVDEFTQGEVLLVDPGDVASLAAGIEGVLFDADVRAQTLEAARGRQQQWSQHGSAADQHASILKSVRRRGKRGFARELSEKVQGPEDIS